MTDDSIHSSNYHHSYRKIGWVVIVLFVTIWFEQPSSWLEQRRRHEPQPQEERRRLSSSPDKILRFHEIDLHKLQKAIVERRQFRSSENYKLQTSYDQAIVVEQAPGWFPYTQICQETCCATAVAISLSEKNIIHTVMGMELADTSIAHYPNAMQFHTKEQMLFLNEELAPCLQPGTIIQYDNHAIISNYFWKKVRPLIKVPFTIFSSESDGDTPDGAFSHHNSRLSSKKGQRDDLLVKWYGTNPNYRYVKAFEGGSDKFVPVPLGLSRMHDQEPYLTYYLKQTNYQNPFEEKERWTSAFASATNPPDKWLFVNFNVHQFAKHRKVVYEKLCEGHMDPYMLSCRNQTFSDRGQGQSQVSPEMIYAKASEYLLGASPPGTGWDCYRTYELLLLGVIPVVDGARLGSRELFEDLPVIFLHDFLNGNWTRDSLYQQARKYVLSDEFAKRNFTKGWNKLFTRHWQRQILKDAGRDVIVNPEGDGIDYYKAWRYSLKKKDEAVYCSTLFECQSKSYIDQTPVPTAAA